MKESRFIEITIDSLVAATLKQEGVGESRLGRVSFENTREGCTTTIGRRGYIQIEIKPEERD